MQLGVAMETKQSSLRGAERRKVKCENQSPLLHCRKYQRIWRGWQEPCPGAGCSVWLVPGCQGGEQPADCHTAWGPAHKTGGADPPVPVFPLPAPPAHQDLNLPLAAIPKG